MLSSRLLLSEVVTNIKKDNSKAELYIDNICDNIDQNESVIQAFIKEDNRRTRLHNDLKKIKGEKKDLTLFGIPVGIKDLFNAYGFATRAGSKLPPSLFEGKEASCVTRLKNAGALIAGKTVTTEFAYFQPGPTRNPVNPEHTPGGSSSGSAAAVAAGFCPLALGTQTIGSITRPASFCGIIGYKPSYGRIPADGLVPFSPSADHVGFFTQDIQGVKIAASVLCDKWKDIGEQINKEIVIGVPVGNYMEQAEKYTLKIFEEQTDILRSKGFKIKEIDIFGDINKINYTHKLMIAYEIAEVHKEWFKEYSHLYSDHTRQLILEGQKISKADAEKAISGRITFREKICNMMVDNNIDIFVTPSTVTDALKGLSVTGSPIMNLPWTYSGLPTITIPAGKSSNNLPLGLNFAGLFGYDEELQLAVKRVSS